MNGYQDLRSLVLAHLGGDGDKNLPRRSAFAALSSRSSSRPGPLPRRSRRNRLMPTAYEGRERLYVVRQRKKCRGTSTEQIAIVRWHREPPQNPLAHSPREPSTPACYSARIPASFTTFAHFKISEPMNRPNSSGVIWAASPPSLSKRFFVSAEARITESSPWRRSMTGRGVPAGATIPHQLVAS